MQLYQFDIKRKIEFKYKINISWKNKIDKILQNLKKNKNIYFAINYIYNSHNRDRDRDIIKFFILVKIYNTNKFF